MRKSIGIGFALALAAAPLSRAYAADSTEAVMEKVAKVMENMASVVDDNKANCDVMADKVGKFIDDNVAIINEGRAASAKATPEQKKIWDAKYKARVEAAGKKMQEGLVRCRTSARVKAAMEKLKAK